MTCDDRFFARLVRKNVTAVALATVAYLGSASTGSAIEYVIGDFEGGSLNGWSNNGSAAILSPTAVGATRGSSALQISVAPGIFSFNFTWDHGSYTGPGAPMYELFPSVTALKFDLTYDRSQFPGPHTSGQTYSNLQVVVNSGAGWAQYRPSYDDWASSGNPATFEPGGWDWANTHSFPSPSADVATMTVTCDFTQNITTLPVTGAPQALWLTAKQNVDSYFTANQNNRWFQLNMALNTGPGFDEAGFIIDNIRLVAPDPAHPGDFDGNGNVDGADFVAWQTNFPLASGATLAQGDADGNGTVDGADFVVWQTNFPFPPAGGASPVPEPWSALLFGLTLPALAIAARRHRAA